MFGPVLLSFFFLFALLLVTQNAGSPICRPCAFFGFASHDSAPRWRPPFFFCPLGLVFWFKTIGLVHSFCLFFLIFTALPFCICHFTLIFFLFFFFRIVMCW
nr:hypothetical protein [Pandoravirus massiliensis]